VKVEFSDTFEKDLEAIVDPKMLARFEKAIDEVRQAKDLISVRNLKRLSGKPGRYRIRVGNFRVGFKIAGGAAVFLRCLHRKDIYRYFP
jgi:mRNA interferase RelE/StbE